MANVAPIGYFWVLGAYLNLTLPHSETIAFEGGSVPVWPEALPVKNVGDERIFGAIFRDAQLTHPSFIARLYEQTAITPKNQRALGGTKVRDAATWEMPAGRLLTLRALHLFCRTRNVPSAHVRDRWGNVMKAGDYSTPHCHFASDAAVVYFMQKGEDDPNEPLDGNFELIDPRIPACCPRQPERPERGMSLSFVPGFMVLFPAEFVHHVRPYSGSTPRITLAWNISAGLSSDENVEAGTQAYDLKTAVMKPG
jgi:hypothetical protein